MIGKLGKSQFIAHPSVEVNFGNTEPLIFFIFIDAPLSIFAHSEILSFWEKILYSTPEMIAPPDARLYLTN